ncbi:hypothetical protein [Sediminibacillus halophilus]|uniref:Uncharacterized protein n=1 Tax=Sediminibacillus halophilus TaxID=482461 RepID=A0A1G9XWQ5_9BACI|nr:hypothetical protein [Sediminibacillus halophilus]SDN01207.1 hypothetical protein SAMN05216244_3997 [Sediminibacillus halophilus]
MAKVLFSLLIMVLLFFGGMLTGINQVAKGPEGTIVEDEEIPAIDKKTPLITVKEPEAESVLAARKDYEPVKETHFTQKLAAALGNFLSWFYNQVIAIIYQLVQVFF